RLRPDGVGALRRDRGRLPRRLRGGHRGGADQDRFPALLRPARQVQPAPADRGGREPPVRGVAGRGGVVTGHDRLAAARRFLVGQGLHAEDERSRWTPLTGGVSSDLWRVELPGRTLCVKAALPRLRVADEWFAPVGRNAVEYEWLTFAQEHVPGSCPRVLAHDAEAGFFAMEYLPPQHHRLWKAALLAGDVDPAFAGRVGDVVGRLHKASAADASVEQRFATDANFDVLRITPYLRVSAERNPDVADRLHELADRLAGTRLPRARGPQPQEHPHPPDDGDPAGRRVRLVRGPGLRPGLLPHAPAAQDPGAAGPGGAAARSGRAAPRRAPQPPRLGAAPPVRRARRRAPARAAPRPGRRVVPGRVPHRTRRPLRRPGGGPAPPRRPARPHRRRAGPRRGRARRSVRNAPGHPRSASGVIGSCRTRYSARFASTIRPSRWSVTVCSSRACPMPPITPPCAWLSASRGR